MKIFKNPLVIILYLFTFPILVAGCSSSSDSGVDTVTNSIIGNWAYTYPGSGCVETYTFNTDKTWSESALDERETGTYVFEETVNVGERHALTIVVVSDNGQSDCEGVSHDGTGIGSTLYVSFPSRSAMEWYLAVTGGTPELTLTVLGSFADGQIKYDAACASCHAAGSHDTSSTGSAGDLYDLGELLVTNLMSLGGMNNVPDITQQELFDLTAFLEDPAIAP